jgi:hypothetical protein
MSLFDAINSVSSNAADPGAYLKRELEEGLEPLLTRVDRLEKKLELLFTTMERVEAMLTKLQPLLNLLKKLPFK